jgi:hypothetical protein
MINIQTDLLPLSPSVLSKMSRSNLERIAAGSGIGKSSFCREIDWGYSGLPAWFFEELFFIATGSEWEQDA